MSLINLPVYFGNFQPSNVEQQLYQRKNGHVNINVVAGKFVDMFP